MSAQAPSTASIKSGAARADGKGVGTLPISTKSTNSRKGASENASIKKAASSSSGKTAKDGSSKSAPKGNKENDGSAKSPKSPKSKKSKKGKDERPWWKRLLFCYRRPPLKNDPGSDEAMLATALGPAAEETSHPTDADISRAVKNWEVNFLVPFIDAYAVALSRDICAIKVQRIVRGFLARRRYVSKREEAIQSFVTFWLARIEEREAKAARTEETKALTKQFAENYAMSLVQDAAWDKMRDTAARRIQRFMMRHFRRSGLVTFSTIALEPLRRRRLRVPKPEKPKFSEAVQRLIWAKTSFEPEGGWPRPDNTAKFDIWQHIDRPPKKQKFGLKTKLVKAATANANAREVLRSDGTSWVAVPVQVHPAGPPGLSSDDYANRKFEASPYRPIDGFNRNQELLDAKKRRDQQLLQNLTDDQKMRKFGYYRFLKNQMENAQLGAINPTKSSANISSNRNTKPYRVGGANLMEIDTAPSIFGHTEIQQDSFFSTALNDSIEAAPKTSPGVPGVVLRGIKKRLDVEAVLEGISAVDAIKAAGHDSNYPGFKTYVKRIQEKTRGKLGGHPKERADIQHLKSSSWGKIKAGVEERIFDQWERQGGSAAALDDVALGGVMPDKTGVVVPSLANTVCVWPTKPKKHYKLKYTWLPQPMLKRAVENAYYDENVRNAQSSFDTVTSVSPVPDAKEAVTSGVQWKPARPVGAAPSKPSPVSALSRYTYTQSSLTEPAEVNPLPKGGLLGAIEASSVEEHLYQTDISSFGGNKYPALSSQEQLQKVQ